MAASLDGAPIETMERAFRAEGWPIALLRETYSMEGDGRPHEVQVNEFADKAFRECQAQN